MYFLTDTLLVEMNSVPKRMRAVQVVFFLALITIGKLSHFYTKCMPQYVFTGFALKCQVCQNEGLCMDDNDIGVATECPEDMTGCFYSKSSTYSLLHIAFLLFDLLTFASSLSEMMNKRKCQKVRRDFCYSWMQGEVCINHFSNTFCIRYFLLVFSGETNVLLLYN